MKHNIKETICNGVVYGVTKKIEINYEINDFKCLYPFEEISIYDKAITEALDEVNSLRKNDVFKDEDFINVHAMILCDPELRRQVVDNIVTHEYKASKAFCIVIDKYINDFLNARSTYLQERNLDLKDIKQRVLSKLDNTNKKIIDEDFILVIDELVPSLLMTYKGKIKGVIAKKGGPTAHSSILCKARDIPFVLVDSDIPDNTMVIVDSRKGIINDEPTKEEINKCKKLIDSIDKESQIMDFSSYKVKLLANVSSNEEIIKVNKYNMDGVGLYRTEFIFMNLDRALTLEEQYDIYKEAVTIAKDKPICFRTFDIGDDKQLSYIETHKKGIDNYKNNRYLFNDQVKALLGANINDNIKIMFPMIESYQEFSYLRDWVFKIKKESNNQTKVSIGMMLETKEAISHIDDFIDVDFISLGTNDLTSELYHIERKNVLNYESFIYDLIERLRPVVLHCKKYSIDLSICGELASVKEVVKMLYDLGIRNYSVSVSSAKALEVNMKELLNVE